jgi:hypothetical protein
MICPHLGFVRPRPSSLEPERDVVGSVHLGSDAIKYLVPPVDVDLRHTLSEANSRHPHTWVAVTCPGSAFVDSNSQKDVTHDLVCGRCR